MLAEGDIAFPSGRQIAAACSRELNAFRRPMAPARKAREASRRDWLRSVAVGAAGLSFWDDQTIEAYQQKINTNSKASDSKITDLRVAVVARAPMTWSLIRIDTNQGFMVWAKCAMERAKTMPCF